MPVSRFDKIMGVARSVKAFLAPKSAARHGVVSDSGRREEIKKRRERVRIRSERRAAREQKRAERRKKKENKVQREMVGQEVDYLSNERRDPPRERIETAHLRQLPDFIIIGTQRGGTTSLYRYLTEHPDVGAAFRKEVHFFDRYYEKGMDWYLAHFPVRGEFPVVGEASPYYLLHPEAPERARKAVPHARFIVLLRNPVDRAYSQYHMKVKRGVEPLPFEDAIDKERERLGSTDDPVSLAWRHYSYVERSLYVDQLRRWMNVFPREQFLILKSEDLYEDPQRILHQTQEYLGLRPWSLPGYEAYNLKEYADIDPATRRRLVDYFAPHNQQLYALLGRDLGWEHER